ncbi:hypothetical protein THAOC_05788 [Thalassiosira oceanica]|uniref:Uncharacterized protein n=1 Tax=Thalassiosira oceanica TaxID=159749 RepID=K0T211_THAOC|nr:hypothetical protein THAOC_05788 [Thalassiosira oceanica]|eukprot:EJK72658.1 hypothetical protein THAOC_05788 [Thalassiosira oceanica]
MSKRQQVRRGINITTIIAGETLASDLLKNNAWKYLAIRLFELASRKGQYKVDPNVPTSREDLDKADMCLKMLIQRNTIHLRMKVGGRQQQDRQCLDFARNNLPLIAALLILQTHLKRKISCIKENECLLSLDKNAFPLTVEGEADTSLPGPAVADT